MDHDSDEENLFTYSRVACESDDESGVPGTHGTKVSQPATVNLDCSASHGADLLIDLDSPKHSTHNPPNGLHVEVEDSFESPASRTGTVSSTSQGLNPPPDVLQDELQSVSPFPEEPKDLSPTAARNADGFQADIADPRRELLIYALPLLKDKLIYLPVVNWREPPEEPKSGWKGAMGARVSSITEKLSQTWQAWKDNEPGTIKNKVYNAGQRYIVENLTPEERLMKGIPKNVTKVVIRHPASIAPDAIMEQLTQMTGKHSFKAAGKAAVAGLLLPLAFGIDTVIIPGPAILTYYTIWELYKGTSGVTGTQRLTKYISQEGKDTTVRVNYAGDHRLDRYVDIAASSPTGILDEEDIEHLVNDLKEADLYDPLMELRRRELRQSVTRKDEYMALPQEGR